MGTTGSLWRCSKRGTGAIWALNPTQPNTYRRDPSLHPPLVSIAMENSSDRWQDMQEAGEGGTGTEDLMHRSWFSRQPGKDMHVLCEYSEALPYIFPSLSVFGQSRKPYSPRDCWTWFFKNNVTELGSVACRGTFKNWGSVMDREFSVHGSQLSAFRRLSK